MNSVTLGSSFLAYLSVTLAALSVLEAIYAYKTGVMLLGSFLISGLPDLTSNEA